MIQEPRAKTAVIIGASSDLGLPITRDLLQQGFRIVAHYHSSKAQLVSLNAENLVLEQTDLTDDAAVAALFERAAVHLGQIDVVVHLVGPYHEAEVLTYAPSVWRQTVEMNLNVAYSVAYAARPWLEASKGQLVLFAFSGVEKVQAWTSATAYGAAKAGVAILAKSLAVALGPKGVRVNAICPGYIDAERFSSAERAAIAATIPQERLGRADEVAAVVRWLATDSPQYMNGALLAVGGGWEP